MMRKPSIIAKAGLLALAAIGAALAVRYYDAGLGLAANVAILLAVLVFYFVMKGRAAQSPAERANYALALEWGDLREAMICPHCQARASVRAKIVTRKKGISGGKATGALLTGGVSLLATGLSRKEDETQAHCMNCGSTWYF
jgi:hypothetical protein